MSTLTMLSGENMVITGGSFNLNAFSHTASNPLNFILGAFGNNYVAGATHDNNDVLDVPKCHPGTRTSFLRGLLTWIKDTESPTYITWLHGPAGAGKSAIARSLATTLHGERLLAGSFFFFRTDSRRNTEKALIATLAYQIACNIPQAQSNIAKAIAADPAICSRSLQTQFRTLILEPLERVLNSGSNTVLQSMVIIIDGLDECLDRDARSLILSDVVFNALPHLHGCIKFLVISRPEYDIQRSFHSPAAAKQQKYINTIKLQEDLQAYEDVRKYLHDNFDRIKQTHPLRGHLPLFWPSEHAIEQLVEKSSGYFIYAATVIKYIESDFDHPQERLAIIINLKTTSQNPYAALDSLYLNILTSSRTNHTLLADIFSFVFLNLPVGNTIHLDEGTMRSVRFIETILFLQHGGVQLALLDLKSLVGVAGSISFWHKSFSDFLLDSSRSNDFHTTGAHACTLIAKGCLRLLSDKTGLVQRQWRGFNLKNPMIDCHYLLSVCCTKALLDSDLETAMMKYKFNVILLHIENRLRAFWLSFSCLLNYQQASIFKGTKVDEHLNHQFDCYFVSELRHFIPLDSAVMGALRAAVSPVHIDWKTYRKLSFEEPSQFFNYESYMLASIDNSKLRLGETILCEFFHSKDRAGEYYLGELPTEQSTLSIAPTINRTVSNTDIKAKCEVQDQTGPQKRQRIRRSMIPTDITVSLTTKRKACNGMVPSINSESAKKKRRKGTNLE